jgi:NAD-reducing hydrogenase large subunit
MSALRTIEIDPVTRIEGHGKVVITLDDTGKVDDAYFGVVEFRGFEKFCEGRMIWDMPTITSRICGFCPVSHHLASVKAAESLLGVEPPPPATKLRELLNLGQIIQSHALHFFFCGMPDFLGPEVDVADRSVFGLLENNENVAKNAIRLRKVGQDVVDTIGGGRLHPVACIPGGMSRHLEYIDRVRLIEGVLSGIKLARMAVSLIKDMFAKNREHFMRFASFPSLYMGLVNDGNLALYDGKVRVIDHQGSVLGEFEARDYLNHIEERADARSWTKTVVLKGRGEDDGAYRVASLARINVADGITTPAAAEEFKELKQISEGKPIQSSLFFHYARMIELLYAVERARDLLMDPEIMSTDVRVPVKRTGGEGVGVLEAPRGTLFHHYWANDDGRITKVNLLVSTAHNKLAMNRSVKMVADEIVKDGGIEQKDLNKVETAIRCYDPCLSCSTHAYGRMPLEITIKNSDGGDLTTYRYGDLASSERKEEPIG